MVRTFSSASLRLRAAKTGPFPGRCPAPPILPNSPHIMSRAGRQSPHPFRSLAYTRPKNQKKAAVNKKISALDRGCAWLPPRLFLAGGPPAQSGPRYLPPADSQFIQPQACGNVSCPRKQIFGPNGKNAPVGRRAKHNFCQKIYIKKEAGVRQRGTISSLPMARPFPGGIVPQRKKETRGAPAFCRNEAPAELTLLRLSKKRLVNFNQLTSRFL